MSHTGHDDDDRITDDEREEGADDAEDEEESGSKLLPKHTIFLSHSGKDKDFVRDLCADLKREHYFPFFDQRRKALPIGEEYPELIIEAARKCLVAVIVVSEDYLTSKWPMVELLEFSNATKRYLGKSKVDNPDFNSSMKLVPAFYRVLPNEIKPDELWEKLIAKHSVQDLRFDKEKYKEAIRMLKRFNGLNFTPGMNITKYRRELTNQILKLVPPAYPIDTSGIEAWKRLCKVIFGMFEPKVRIAGVCKYLGLYGKPGVGKTTICWDAMGHYYRKKYRGRLCRVRLDNEATGNSDANKAAAAKIKLKRLMEVIKQLVGKPNSMSAIVTEKEGQSYLQHELRHMKQPVFLVVDNVSAASQEEAKWYADAEFPLGSYVLVTSRRREVVEKVLGDPKYCKEFPALQEEEAKKLFLVLADQKEKAAAITALAEQEREILVQCLAKCAVNDQPVPRLLTTFATFLKDKGSIPGWTEFVNRADSILGQEYHDLDEISKHIILDLAYFADGMCFTHLDFHSELEWEDQPNLKLAIDFLAMLHDVPYHDAEKKVKNLQGSFLMESTIEVSEDRDDLLYSVITTNLEAQKWGMLSRDVDEDMEDEEGVEYYYDIPNEEDFSTLKRVALWEVSFDRDLHRISQWRSVKLLSLYSVKSLRVLDLQGLRSLRALMVDQCEELQSIVCTCNSKFSDHASCYDKNRGCLSELRVVQLEYLPSLKKASFTKHCRRLETMWFYECPDLAHMPDLQYCRRLKRLRLPCGDFEGFQGLENNSELTELAFHWETDTVRNFTKERREKLLEQVMSFTDLKVLDIVDEKELYDWIPAGFQLNVSELCNLTFLDLSCSSTIEEIGGLEELSELRFLGLYGCCMLRTLPKLRMMPKLLRLCIGHCHSLILDHFYEEYEDFKIGPFHAPGESCSFGAHECLEPEEDEVLYKGRQRKPLQKKRATCRKCDPTKWETQYLANDKGNVQTHYKTEDFNDDLEEGVEEGDEDDAEESNEDGVEEGNEDGAEEGNEDGAEEGNEDGAEEGNEDGAEEGNEDGAEEGNEDEE